MGLFTCAVVGSSKYLLNDEEVKDYTGGRSEKDLVSFMLEALLDEEGVEMAKKLKKGEEVAPFLQSRAIKQLGMKNFNRFIGERDAAMVFFYQPDCLYCNAAKPHFLKAAKMARMNGAKGRGYGIVDCSKEIDLCMGQLVQKYPTFKLYVGGKFLSTFDEPPHFEAIRQFVENAPEAPTVLSKKLTREDL
ncbi:protein disulfide-isomerase [Plakobranchus ocellatus]|uniref:Protein disulfide-isomerase n=1 Tax=Plakobranchus ocellatus TaxID=259542 RepID=A0AAV4BMT5_9GAST|nr:protein disulfide-isomerase [Plakobranchus ocellatus]